MVMMRSATLVAPRDLRIEQVEKPVVDEDDIVIVRIESLGICGSNLHLWYGEGSAISLAAFPMPGALGHEHAGVVEEVGKRVTRVKPGDRVTIDPFQSESCGKCGYCASGFFGHCENPRSFGVGGFTEYLKLSERGLYHLPDCVKTEVAAVVEPMACSVAGIRRAGIPGGETVVVLGAGVLGLSAAGAAKALGAGKVILTAKHDAQAALAERFGVDVVVRSSEEDLIERILLETGGGGADMVVETVGGHAPTLGQAMDIVRNCGKMVVLGLWDELVPVDSWKAILKDITMYWSLTHGMMDKRSDYELCLEWMASRKVPAQDLVTHVLPLDDIQAAFELSADKSQGVVKVCVKP
ncbi:MAG: alcohol dehydrogenase catalytic domain-containing protein [Pseudomonadales bacterium]|jgi:threonine dehydrogenase-like Zn-dependent dehydrogenase|nr:alcohol dehydrogenase catalytic domain-containing protein [Pseudomonadales bacterium]MDP6972633.1 alcohol dehydrogenase catalytic domain-containing protein [Pseudomonadales bacterium]|tara:strand:+ start:32 stop:1090 length:1059 start_codon:yes stop_codon:yes gene_type:complete